MKPRGIDLGTGEQLPPSLVGVMVLLDRSGSMVRIKGSMEKAFRDFVEEQKALDTEGMWVTLCQFDEHGVGGLSYEKTYDRTPLAQVDGFELCPRGGTPLRDAFYKFLTEARDVVDDTSDSTERLLLVIISDGKEEAGPQVHTWAQVRELVKGIESTECEIIWMGTDASVLEAQEHVPAMAAAGAALSWQANAVGAAYMAKGFSNAAKAARVGMRSTGATEAYMSSGGSYDIEQDEAFKDLWKKAQDAKSGSKT